MNTALVCLAIFAPLFWVGTVWTAGIFATQNSNKLISDVLWGTFFGVAIVSLLVPIGALSWLIDNAPTPTAEMLYVASALSAISLGGLYRIFRG